MVKRGDVRIYELYWDLYLIENLLLDGAMLVLTLLLMHKRICFMRVAIAAMLGAFMSTFVLVSGIRFGLLYILILFITGMIMMKLSMKQKEWNELMQGMVYYFTLMFAFARGLLQRFPPIKLLPELNVLTVRRQLLLHFPQVTALTLCSKTLSSSAVMIVLFAGFLSSA